MNPGLIHAALAFTAWGLYPLYFRLIAEVPPVEVIVHRSVWSLVFVFALLMLLKRRNWLGPVLRQPRLLAPIALAALLLSANWFIYVFAVQTEHVVEASLGYFITPLVNVALGVVVLKERLRRTQWTAIALAAAGVVWLTLATGRAPWIALVIAGSFGLYGLLRKIAPLGAIEGFAAETLVLAPLMVPALLWSSFAGGGVLAQGDPRLTGLILASGPLTAIPLLLFAAAARRLPLATLGLMQYLSPTIQFALGVFAFGEAFDVQRLAGFVLIWIALAIVSADALAQRPARPLAPPR